MTPVPLSVASNLKNWKPALRGPCSFTGKAWKDTRVPWADCCYHSTHELAPALHTGFQARFSLDPPLLAPLSVLPRRWQGSQGSRERKRSETAPPQEGKNANLAHSRSQVQCLVLWMGPVWRNPWTQNCQPCAQIYGSQPHKKDKPEGFHCCPPFTEHWDHGRGCFQKFRDGGWGICK